MTNPRSAMKAMLVLLACVAACGGEDAGTSPEHDTRSPGDDVSDMVPEVITPADIIERHPDIPPETIPMDIEDDDCAPPKPFLFEGACVECLSSADCDDEDLACNPENHRCELSSGECSYCEFPYPACVQIDGVWSCVQCKYDEDCTQGFPCNEDLHACEGYPLRDDPYWPCQSDEDCVAAGGPHMACAEEVAACYSEQGWCDGVVAGCIDGACVKLWVQLTCWIDPANKPLCGVVEQGAVCTCIDTLEADALLSCIVSDTCDGGCYGDAICVGPSFLEAYGYPQDAEVGLCIPKDILIQELD